MSALTILVVDDEQDLLELVRYIFTREGFKVICAASAEEALDCLNSNRPALILLDLMLPGMDGFTLTRRIKSDPDLGGIPIIMFSARNSEVDVVSSLEIGAEDYITKPFKSKVLVSRVRSVLRCHAAESVGTDAGGAQGQNRIEKGNLTIDLDRHVVLSGGEPVDLTCSEFSILSLLASRPGWAYSRAQIVDHIRGGTRNVTERSVDVLVVGLRRKLGRHLKIIEAVRGVGYRFSEGGPTP